MTDQEKSEIRAYFDHYLYNYNCGDIREMLEKQLLLCGPILATVVNGIDLAGAMLCGFGAPSSARSEAFMVKYLGISSAVAAFIYASVRCGISHEGAPKNLVYFFVTFDVKNPQLIYLGIADSPPQKMAFFDVTELARMFLAAIETISLDVTTHFGFVPDHTSRRALNDQNLFDRAMNENLPPLADLESQIDLRANFIGSCSNVAEGYFSGRNRNSILAKFF